MKPHANLARDVRSDSPEYSAKYTTYSVIDMESKMVLDIELINVSETNTNNSVAMEKLGATHFLAAGTVHLPVHRRREQAVAPTHLSASLWRLLLTYKTLYQCRQCRCI